MEKKQDNLMEISDLTVRYNTDDAVVHAVNNFNLKLVRGEARGLVGETGAGKSIMIEAVSLALGSRADTAFVRSGREKATIQMIADYKGTEYIITREISAAGSVWNAGGVLPKRRENSGGEPRSAGLDCNSGHGRRAYLEAADAAFHCGRHNLLYAAASICILTICKTIPEQALLAPASFDLAQVRAGRIRTGESASRSIRKSRFAYLSAEAAICLQSVR